MNVKNFFMAGLAGGITDFLLGWVFYGMLFFEYFGSGEPNMTWIVAGCLSFGFLMSYIFVRWANLLTFTGGMQAGAVIGLFMGLMRNFFDASMETGAMNYEMFAVDVVISIVMAAIVGGVVAAVNGAMSKNTAG